MSHLKVYISIILQLFQLNLGLDQNITCNKFCQLSRMRMSIILLKSDICLIYQRERQINSCISQEY